MVKKYFCKTTKHQMSKCQLEENLSFCTIEFFISLEALISNFNFLFPAMSQQKLQAFEDFIKICKNGDNLHKHFLQFMMQRRCIEV